MWVLVNLLTFGNVNKLFQIQKKDVQLKVLRHYGIDSFGPQNVELDALNFTNVLNILSIYRNICAHNERLYCFDVKMNIDDAFCGYLSIFPESNDVVGAREKNESLMRVKRKRLERRRKGISTLLFGLRVLLSKSDFKKLKMN